jgi:hypothetical protein
MAEKKVIELEVNSNLGNLKQQLKQAQGDVQDLSQDFVKTSNSVKDATKKTDLLNDSIKSIKNSTGSAENGFKKIKTAAVGVGTALKAAGIGLIISSFVALKSAFEQNQEVATTFSAVMETISIVFNKTVGAVISAAKASYEATGGFNALAKVMGGLLNIVLAPLKLTFFSLKLGIQELQIAWEKSFFGDKDPKVIKELRKNIKATEKDIVDIGKNVVKSGKDIYNNFGEAIGEVVDLGKRGIEEVSKISISAAYEQGKALVNAKNNAAIAAAQQSLLIEKYDMQAEKLRQIRDEERNSITERIKANNDLKAVLDNQEKAMLAQASLQVQAAQLEFNKAKTTENQVALLDAQANKVGVLAQIEGLRSEQLANDLALQREADELTKTRTESEVTLAIEREKATNELIKDEEKKLQAQINTANKEKELQLTRLKEQIDVYKLGTQGRLDAEIAYNEAKQEIDLQIMSYEEQLAVKKLEKIAKEKVVLEELTLSENELKLQKLTAQYEADQLLYKDNKEILKALDVKYSKDKEDLENEELAKKRERTRKGIDMAMAALSILNDAFQMSAGKSEKDQRKAFKTQKAFNLASAIANTYLAVTGALTAGGNPIKLATGMQFVEAGIAAATGAIQIAKIAGTQFEGGGSSAGGGGGGNVPTAPTMSAPQFNVVGQSGVNQLASLNQQPIQAYVVSGQVTSQQALDRNRLANATLGG